MLFVIAFIVTGAPALMTSLLTNSEVLSEITLVPSAYAQASYKGPLCQGSSGAYCCKDSEGSCSAGAKCSGCKSGSEEETN